MTSWAQPTKGGYIPRFKLRASEDPTNLPTVRFADFRTAAKAKHHAEQLAEDAEREARRTGVDPKGGRRTVAAARAMLVNHERAHLSADSRARDESIWRNHVGPRWAHRGLDSIRRDETQSWVDNDLAPVRAPDTVQKIVAVLNKTVEHAIFMRWVTYSGVAGVKLPKARQARPKAITQAQTDALLDLIDDDWLPLVAFMATTPVRPGEALGLPVRNVDPLRNRVFVEQQWTERHGGLLKPHTKTEEVRWTPVAPDVMDVLVELSVGARPDDFVFTTPTGRPVNLGNFTKRVLGPAGRRAGITRPVTAYTLRHTSITRMVERLHTVRHRKELATWAGHSDRTMADIYTAVGTDFDGTEMAAMEGTMARRSGMPDNVSKLRPNAG